MASSPSSNFSLRAASISKRNCFVEFLPAGIMVTDCGSTNGTFVGQQRIEPFEQTPLRDGQTLSLGRFAFTFRTAAGFYAQVKSLLA